MRRSFHRSSPYWSLAMLLCLVMLEAACQRPQQSSELNGYVSRDDDRWPEDVISVCFEQARGFERDRQLIQQIVSSEFARADIHFSGWNICRNEDQGIRISFDENAGMSKTKDFGRKNSEFNQNLLIGLKSRCAGVFSASVCEGNIAIHEFGHALGLRHEMNRRDNQTCTQDQTSGEGEDALQLGTYDTRSIMDYCFLYEANAKLEALGLSEQDVAALKAVKSGLVASVDKPVPMLVKETWTANVKGPELSFYRFALGPKNDLDCENLSAYSESLPLYQPISIDPRSIQTAADTVWTLCMLGENAAGQRQDMQVYSAIDFRIQSSATAVSTPPVLVRNPILYRQNQQIIMEIEMGPGQPLRSLYASLAYTQSSIYRSISNARFESKDLGSGRYQLFFKTEDFPANGEVYVSTLELTDILGQKLELFSSAAWTSFYDQPWTSPALLVDWSSENDLQGPSFIQLKAFPQELEAGSKASFTMEIAENSRLQSMRLGLRSEKNTLEPVLQWQWLSGQTYLVSLEIPPTALNGLYQFDSLILEDIHYNQSYYSLNTSSSTIDGTAQPAPVLLVKNGLAYETTAPQVLSFGFSAGQYKRNEKAFVELEIKDESSIRQVNVVLRILGEQGSSKSLYGIDLGEISGKRRIELNTARDHPRGTYTIQEITLVDRFGNSTAYRADPERPGFLTGGLAMGSIELIDP